MRCLLIQPHPGSESEKSEDFYCHECKPGIELDSMHHQDIDVEAYDESRTRYIELYGVTIIWFRNDEVMNEVEKVLLRIKDNLKELK